VLALLLLAYILNFLDRQILGILAQPIKADLNLTDTQFGAIGGLAFALLYSALGVPLAILADKTRRSWVVAGSLAVWSAFTALCGMAHGYWQLFFCRLGVGFGEAGGVAPSYALIADYFPPERRARALATFSLGIPCSELARGIPGHGDCGRDPRADPIPGRARRPEAHRRRAGALAKCVCDRRP
jgi:MFS family permease